MTTSTPNLGLVLYNSTTDSAEYFSNFRAVIAGTSLSSNFYKIDTAYGSMQTQVDDIQAGAYFTLASYISANYYEATVTGITAYNTGMKIILKLDTASAGTVTLNINSLGIKSVMKINSAGTPANISAGELMVGKYYLFAYDGTRWVWVDATSADQIYAAGTSGNFLRVSSSNTLEDSGSNPSTFAVAAKGVTNGDSHNHDGGDGSPITILPETISLTGDISPSQITSNQNNYAPTGLSTASVIRISTDASRDITGLTGGSDGRIIIISNIGSFDAVLKNENASSTASNRFSMSADTTISSNQEVMMKYDSTLSRWRVVGGTGGGGGARVTVSSISPTTANINSTIVTGGTSVQLADVSGMTANRNYVLLAGTAGDVVELVISVGDDTYAFIIIGNTGISINGGTAATEWSRVFITGEKVRFVATSSTNWQVDMDGRIPCTAAISDINSQSIANTTFTKVVFDTADANIGSLVDLTNDKITIRRAGTYKIGAQVYYSNFLSPSSQCVTYKNGSATGMPSSEANTYSASAYGVPQVNSFKTFALGDYVELYGRQASGSSQTMKPSAPCLLNVQEILS